MTIDNIHEVVKKKVDSRGRLILSVKDADVYDFKDFLSTLPDSTLLVDNSSVKDVVDCSFQVIGLFNGTWHVTGITPPELRFTNASITLTFYVNADGGSEISVETIATIIVIYLI